MRSRLLAALLTASIFVSRAAVRADEPKAPPTAEQAADAAAAAWKAKDEAALVKLAEQDTPDPWLVADALLLKGEPEAAAAFAKAAPRKDVARLPEFVAAWRDAEADKTARAKLAKINAALMANRPADALDAANSVPDEAMPYLRVRGVYGRGLALTRVGRHVEASDAMRTAAQEAQGLGWLERAGAAMWEAVRSERLAKNGPRARETAERLLAFETERGHRASIAYAHGALAAVHADDGRWDEAREHHQRALEIFRETKDRLREAATLNHLAWAAYRGGKLNEIQEAVLASLAISEPAGLWSEAAHSHDIYGMTFQSVGRYTSAAKRFGLALEAAKKAREAPTVARIHLLIGRCLAEAGDVEGALAPLQSAVQAYETLGPAGATGAKVGRARLVWCLAALRRIEEAQSFLKAIDTPDSPPSGWAHAVSLRARGRLLRAEGKPAEAAKMYEEARARLLDEGEGTESRLALVESAEAHREAKDLAKARATADAAIEAATQGTDRFTLARAHALAARIRHEQGETAAALDLARQARDALRDLEEPRLADEAEALVKTLVATMPR